MENSNLSEEEVFQAQAGLVSASLERLYDALGGDRFEGTAVDPSGLVKQGNFVLIGPAALFLSDDGNIVGTAEQRLGSLEPAVIPFDDPAQSEAAAQVVTESKGQMPLDPTLGNAHKIEETSDTFLEHVQKGGVVMYPIFAMAGAALLVALLKWLGMMFVRTPSQKRINALLEAVALRDEKTAKQRAKALKGPVGRMLAAGIDHLREPRELIEEVMYVVDDGGKYLGRVSLQRLLTRPENARIETLADPNPPFVRVGDRQNEIQNLFDRHDMICVPVLDEEDRLVGRIPRCIDGNGNENEL